jgi:hypothetical protein
MPHRLILAICVLLPFSLDGCAYVDYQNTGKGQFTGSLDVRWVKPDQFIYIPNKDDPLRFARPNNKVIQPEKMSTDGGSVPRIFWSVKGYSPWGFAPAYIIHDWLFEAHHCKLPGYQEITLDESALILAEGVKTLMEDGLAPRDETTMWSIHEAVRSPIAKAVWEAPNECKAGKEAFAPPGSPPPGELIMRIELGKPSKP